MWRLVDLAEVKMELKGGGGVWSTQVAKVIIVQVEKDLGDLLMVLLWVIFLFYSIRYGSVGCDSGGLYGGCVADFGLDIV